MRMLTGASRLILAACLCHGPVYSQTPKGVLEGDVIDASTAKGIGGARVRILAGQDDPLFTTTDEQGHFQFAGLEFKTYRVEARYPGFVGSRDGAAVVSLMRGSPNGLVRLEMRPGAAIVGKVTDAFGVPLAGAPVEALERRASGERRGPSPYEEDGYQYFMVQSASADDLGQYRLAPLAAGSYYVLVRPGSSYSPVQPAMRQPSDARVRATFYPHALKPAEAKPLELAEGKDLRVDLQVIRQGGARIGGRILGLEPGSLVSVRAAPVTDGAAAGSGTVAGERFSVEDLLPGKYVLEAGKYAAGDFALQNPLAAGRRTVEVGTENVDGLDLTLAPVPDLQGTVVFESGCPAAAVSIQLQSNPLTHGPRNVHVDAGGRFVVQHLFPGQYKAYVQPESPPYAFAKSATLEDVEVLAAGFEVTAQTTGPLRITMSCQRR
jgi:hypothetical protein